MKLVLLMVYFLMSNTYALDILTASSVRCMEKDAQPVFASFNIAKPSYYGTYVEPSYGVAPSLFRQTSTSDKLSFLSAVTVSSWTCPPDGDSIEVTDDVFYLESFVLMPTGELLSENRFLPFDPIQSQVTGSGLNKDQILYFATYDNLTNDNIGVEIFPRLITTKMNIISSLGKKITIEFKNECYHAETKSFSNAVVEYE